MIVRKDHVPPADGIVFRTCDCGVVIAWHVSLDGAFAYPGPCVSCGSGMEAA